VRAATFATGRTRKSPKIVAPHRRDPAPVGHVRLPGRTLWALPWYRRAREPTHARWGHEYCGIVEGGGGVR